MKKLVRIWMLGIIISVILGNCTYNHPSIIVADSTGIQIRDIVAKGNFPDGISFSISADSDYPVQEIKILLKPFGNDRTTYAYMEVLNTSVKVVDGNNVDFVERWEVEGTYEMITGRGSNHRPPGTLIRYEFEITDVNDNVFTTDEMQYMYLDDSLTWDQVTSNDGLVTVYYHGSFVRTRAKGVLDTVVDTLEGIGPVLGINMERSVTIVAYNNYRDMSRSLPFRSQSVSESLQTEGQAWPTERVVVVLMSGSSYKGVVSHEITHILVGEASGKGYASVPAWLNEGLAEYGNLDPTPDYSRALAYGVYTRRIKPLWYLKEFSGNPDEIIISYGQSSSVVRYLVDVYGKDKMADLMSTLQETLSIDKAMTNVYGFDQHGLDTEWRYAIGLEPLPDRDEVEEQIAGTKDLQEAGNEEDDQIVPTPNHSDGPSVENQDKIDPQEEQIPRSGGCTASGSYPDTIPIDLAMIPLIVGFLLILRVRSVIKIKRA